MPWKSNAELPDGVKNSLPEKAQSMFRKVANSVLADGGSDESAMKQAWGAVKQHYRQDGDTWVEKRFEDDIEKDVRVIKVSEELGLVFGWAIVCKIDGQDYYDLNIDRDTLERVPEHVPEDVMTKAAMNFMEGDRPGNEMHRGPELGQFVFAFPLTTEIAKALGIETRKTGLLVAYKPTQTVLQKFKDGTYRGFSIEGISWSPKEESYA